MGTKLLFFFATVKTRSLVNADARVAKLCRTYAVIVTEGAAFSANLHGLQPARTALQQHGPAKVLGRHHSG